MASHGLIIKNSKVKIDKDISFRFFYEMYLSSIYLIFEDGVNNIMMSLCTHVRVYLILVWVYPCFVIIF